MTYNGPLSLMATHSDLFPPVSQARSQPNGLLCVGSNLKKSTLLKAYQQGIFPWYTEGQPLLWWSPDPRMVLFPEHIHVSRSMKRWLKKRASLYTIKLNQNFSRVMTLCGTAGYRAKEGGGWITRDMLNAYAALNQAGYAISFEVFCAKGNLVGGLYGVHLGSVLFAESMFSLHNNVSKWLLILLAQSNAFSLIDCQVYSEHLYTLGADLIPRNTFIQLIQRNLKEKKFSDDILLHRLLVN